MSLPPPDNLAAEIADLKRRLAALERHGQLASSSFQEPGKVRFRDADGDVRFMWGADAPGEISLYYFDGETTAQPAVVVGVVYEEGTETVIGHGLLVQDPETGVDLLQAWRGGTGGWRFRVNNAEGFSSVRSDEDGLLYPRIPQPFGPAFRGDFKVSDGEGVVTTAEGYITRSHTQCLVIVRAATGGTATGRWRLYARGSGETLVDWQAVTVSDYWVQTFTLDPTLWPSQHARKNIGLEVEVTAGTGSIVAYVAGCYVGDPA
jgi:hypothetical protein